MAKCRGPATTLCDHPATRHLRHRRGGDGLRAAMNQSKQEVVRDAGGRWREDAPWAMIGMSSPEWSRYMREELSVEEDVQESTAPWSSGWSSGSRACPTAPGGRRGRQDAAPRWPLALASSANRQIIDFALDAASLAGDFAPRSPPRRWSAASPPPTCTSRRPGGSRSWLIAASRSRIRATACARPRPPAWR